MRYKTSMDNLAKGITPGVTVLFSTIIIGQYSIIKDNGHAIPIYITVALLLIYFGVFIFRPVSYTIIHSTVIIHRPLTNIQLEKKILKASNSQTGKSLHGLFEFLEWAVYSAISEPLPIQGWEK